MNFNFKNKNSIIIILLLILLIASVFCFFLMQKKVEPFITNSNYYNFFTPIGSRTIDSKTYFISTLKENYAYKLTTSSSGYNNETVGPVYSISNTKETNLNFFTSDLESSDISFNMYYITDISNHTVPHDDTYDISIQKYDIKSSTNITLDLTRDQSLFDLSKNVNLLFYGDNSGNIYDLSKIKLSNFNLIIDNVPIIQNGELQGMTQTPPTTPPTPIPGTGGAGPGLCDPRRDAGPCRRPPRRRAELRDERWPRASLPAPPHPQGHRQRCRMPIRRRWPCCRWQPSPQAASGRWWCWAGFSSAMSRWKCCSATAFRPAIPRRPRSPGRSPRFCLPSCRCRWRSWASVSGG